VEDTYIFIGSECVKKFKNAFIEECAEIVCKRHCETCDKQVKNWEIHCNSVKHMQKQAEQNYTKNFEKLEEESESDSDSSSESEFEPEPDFKKCLDCPVEIPKKPHWLLRCKRCYWAFKQIIQNH